MFEFSQEGVKKIAGELRELNSNNSKNKEKFLEYIESGIAPYWTTTEGKIALEELRNFANNDYQNYINYLNTRIDALEDILPNLQNIDQA